MSDYYKNTSTDSWEDSSEDTFQDALIPSNPNMYFMDQEVEFAEGFFQLTNIQSDTYFKDSTDTAFVDSDNNWVEAEHTICFKDSDDTQWEESSTDSFLEFDINFSVDPGSYVIAGSSIEFIGNAYTGVKTVVFDFANNWGYANRMGIRSVDFYFEGTKYTVSSSNCSTYQTSADGTNYASLTFYTAESKTGAASGNGWASNWTNNTNQRIIIVFDTVKSIDKIVINNHHNSGADCTYGVKNTKITVTPDTVTSTVYNAAVSNGEVVFNGILDGHNTSNVQQDEIIGNFGLVPETGGYWIRSAVFDFADNYGHYAEMGVRSIDFYFEGTKRSVFFGQAQITQTNYGSYREGYRAFYTSLSKTGASDYTSWASQWNYNSNNRLCIYFNKSIQVDKLVINNYHSSGGSTDRGAENTKITFTETAYYNGTYNSTVTDGRVVFDSTIDRHASSNAVDDFEIEIDPFFIILLPDYNSKKRITNHTNLRR